MNRCFAKKLGAAVLLCALAGSAFAEMGMYLKGGLGYTYRQMDTEVDMTIDYNIEDGDSSFAEDAFNNALGGIDLTVVPTNLFGISPVFGIEPFTASGNAFVRGLSFEFSLDLAFGKGKFGTEPVSAFAITPGVMAMYSYRFDIGLKLFGGVGVSVPIQRVSGIEDAVQSILGTAIKAYGDKIDLKVEDSAVKVGFDVDVTAGLAYEVTEKIAPYVELGVGFGTSFAFDARVGVIYRLGGGSDADSSSASESSDSADAPAEEAGE